MTTAKERGVILIVEDPMVRNFVRFVLTRGGYETVQAAPARALELLEDPTQHVDALVTNAPVPFEEMGDHVPLVYMAAQPDPEVASHFHSCRMLRKPFQPAELLEAVRDVTAADHVS